MNFPIFEFFLFIMLFHKMNVTLRMNLLMSSRTFTLKTNRREKEKNRAHDIPIAYYIPFDGKFLFGSCFFLSSVDLVQFIVNKNILSRLEWNSDLVNSFEWIMFSRINSLKKNKIGFISMIFVKSSKFIARNALNNNIIQCTTMN